MAAGLCQPHQLQIEISHQEGRVHIRADGVTGGEFRGGSFCIFHHQVATHPKYSILVQIGVIVRENLGYKWPKSCCLYNIMQMRWSPQVASPVAFRISPTDRQSARYS